MTTHISPTGKKVKYLNNRDLLLEIHKSKCSFSSFTDPKYQQHDIILPSIDKINIRTIADAKRNRAKREGLFAFGAARIAGDKKIKLSECTADYKTIAKSDIVIRIMTFDHIPLAPGRKKTLKNTADSHEKVNFPPFQHWKFNDQDELICVGKSHWKGDLETGNFFKDHGRITENLGRMFIKLSERYAQRSNWRGYCVDTETQALTSQGWVGIDEINETDSILSYSDSRLTWSKIKSIYRGDFDGLMHKLTNRSIDALITPNHKMVTPLGLVKAEHIKETDKIIVMGKPEIGNSVELYSNELVELGGWIVTEGCYEYNENKDIKRITIYQNPGQKADRIRNCLTKLEYKFTERLRKNNIVFGISRKNSKEIASIFLNKNFTMDFLMSLTSVQRELLVNTMIDGDGWRVGAHKRFTQKDKPRADMFQALCTLAGYKTNSHYVENHISFGKPVDYYQINLFSQRGNSTKGECINFHGGKRNGRSHPGRGKAAHPNVPTTYYKGRVWCPETEYGSFVARRNGKVYLTGNTYNEEMRGQAILQLSQIGLQFDESKSENPFAYYTSAITNSFTRILNIEKKNQNIRDDMLEEAGLTPSMTRQNKGEFSEEIARQAELYKNIRIPKSQDSDFEDDQPE